MRGAALRQAYWFSVVAFLASLGLLIVHGLIPEKFEVDETTIALLVIALVALLLPLLPLLARYLREMHVPGVHLSFRDLAEDAARRASGMPSAVQLRAEVYGPRPVLAADLPTEIEVAAEEDPNVSVARISMGLERLLRDVVRDLDLLPRGRPLGLRSMVEILEGAERIDGRQAGVFRDIVQMRNRAVHGESITPADAALFAALVRQLVASLDLTGAGAPSE